MRETRFALLCDHVEKRNAIQKRAFIDSEKNKKHASLLCSFFIIQIKKLRCAEVPHTKLFGKAFVCSRLRKYEKVEF